MSQYWVVGAMYGGTEDQAPLFILRGYWELGWADKDAPDQAALRDLIRPGDRMAIKRMMGQGSPQIRITTLGIVTDVDDIDRRIYVNWVLSNLDRVVDSRGCYKSIHGPFDDNDQWTREIFYI